MIQRLTDYSARIAARVSNGCYTQSCHNHEDVKGPIRNRIDTAAGTLPILLPRLIGQQLDPRAHQASILR